MKIADALNQFGPARGFTSMLAGLMSGDLAPISGGQRVSESLTEARARLADVTQSQHDCKSDWAYWGYQGDISYWTAVIALLEAAEITGPDALPDIPYKSKAGVVMDICAEQERYGRRVLEAAKATQRS